ncbi:Atp19 h [Myxozyma melibiosi]|uniref:Atp19 h n=1 Tax=Myxozyma melibiosi TaxID=54550 RepID=A0ABR1FBL1_9ASCO
MAGAVYHVFGRAVKPHQLSIATLGSTAALVIGLNLTKKPAEKPTSPPINAASPEEEDFVKDFMKSLEEKK